MIFPNGFIELGKLKKMINSDEFDVYYEDPVELPDDYDFIKHGFPHGALHKIKNDTELIAHLGDIYSGKVNLCYDLNDVYFEKHPRPGEHGGYKEPIYDWQFSGKNNYRISEFKFRNKLKEDGSAKRSIEVCRYEGDFADTCYVIAYWDLDDEGYEFHSVGHRLFDVDPDDFSTLWEGIVEADRFLKEEWDKRESD